MTAHHFFNACLVIGVTFNSLIGLYMSRARKRAKRDGVEFEPYWLVGPVMILSIGILSAGFMWGQP